MWKVYDNDDNDNDNDGQRTNCDQKSSLEPSALHKYMYELFRVPGGMHDIRLNVPALHWYMVASPYLLTKFTQHKLRRY